MDAPVFEEVWRGHTIKIYHDPDPMNPRDWDNLGTIICGHSRYNLGDRHSFTDAREFLLDLCELGPESDLSVDQLVTRAEKHAVILPVYLYDHSGLAMNTSGFHCPWDSGQVGFIYVTLETIRNEYSVSRVSKALRQKVTKVLKQEVTTYGDYVGGNAYCYVVERGDEEVDACWGFIGDYNDHCLDQARRAVA